MIEQRKMDRRKTAERDARDAARYREWREGHAYWRTRQQQLDDALDLSIEYRKTHH